MPTSRRTFLTGTALSALACATHTARAIVVAGAKTGFKVAVITDEISQDFDHACFVASRDFGMQWVELRALWNKSVLALADTEIVDAKKILAKYNLQVTDIASPLFKVDFPGAPLSPQRAKAVQTTAEATFKQQQEVLESCITMAKQFNTDKVRGFDFWRLENQAPYRAAIDAKLGEAAKTLGDQGLLFVLENEFECNTATARESARTLAAVPSPHFALNWDPANAVMRGELDAFPAGWDLLPKDRIRHCHVKNALSDAKGKMQWSPVGTGTINWAAQFLALEKMNYHDAVSLETHWKGDSGPEASSRTSWAGMKQALDASVA